MNLNTKRLAVLSFVTVATMGVTSTIPAAAVSHGHGDPSIEIDNDISAHVEGVVGPELLLNVIPGTKGDPIEFPRDVMDPIKVEREHLELQFKQPGGSTAAVSRSDAGTVTYSYQAEAYKTHLQLLESPDEEILSDGIRSLIEIEDESAPSEYLYETEISQATRFEVQTDGGVVGYSSDSSITVILPAPWAMDAEGDEVPTRYKIAGDDIIQVVEFDSESQFPIVADPVWFIPVVIAGRFIGQVAVRAASRAAARAAAARAAAAAAAKRVVKTVSGRITSTAAKRCYKGAALGPVTTAYMFLEKRGNGTWKVKFSRDGIYATIGASTATCLSANIR